MFPQTVGFFVPLSGCDSGQDVPRQLTRDQTEVQVSADEDYKELKVTWPRPGSPSPPACNGHSQMAQYPVRVQKLNSSPRVESLLKNRFFKVESNIPILKPM